MCRREEAQGEGRGDLMIDSQVDWIQVRRERRMKIARATREDVEDYILISKLPNAKVVTLYDLPEHWMVGGVAYNFESGTFVFQILSPEFDQMPDGVFSREVEKTRHIIEITRKAVR